VGKLFTLEEEKLVVDLTKLVLASVNEEAVFEPSGLLRFEVRVQFHLRTRDTHALVECNAFTQEFFVFRSH
jgi:hypothetical protein